MMAYIWCESNVKSNYNQYNKKPHCFNMLNWKFVMYSPYIKDKNVIENVQGVYVKTNTTVFIPHISINTFLYYNQMYNPNVKINQYFIYSSYIDPPLCNKCWGQGKLDWIENAISSLSQSVPLLFQKDQTSIIILNYIQNTFFSKTLLNNNEAHCPNCLGIGLNIHNPIHFNPTCST